MEAAKPTAKETAAVPHLMYLLRQSGWSNVFFNVFFNVLEEFISVASLVLIIAAIAVWSDVLARF